MMKTLDYQSPAPRQSRGSVSLYLLLAWLALPLNGVLLYMMVPVAHAQVIMPRWLSDMVAVRLFLVACLFLLPLLGIFFSSLAIRRMPPAAIAGHFPLAFNFALFIALSGSCVFFLGRH
ncbi:MAG: hypothetical protein H7144_18160 [Burkholderiales bacterium]|nr:hypothetical protein [Phycisphaerae bacterium]